jgi:hypothetical protein
MKNCVLILLLLSGLLISCNKAKPAEENVAPEPKINANAAIGRMNDGAFIFNDTVVLKAVLAQNLDHQKKCRGKNISKIYVQQDEKSGGYLLMAKLEDGFSTLGILLEVKGDSFYFMNKDGHISYLLCISSNCQEGCNPEISYIDGAPYLKCSYCAECEKAESELHL